MKSQTRLVQDLSESVARTFGINVRDLDNAWERAQLTVKVGRTRPMPQQLFMVMRGNRPKRMRRTKENNAAFKRMRNATAQGGVANIEDIIGAMPAFTEPPLNAYPERKIGRPRPHRIVPVKNSMPGWRNKPEHPTGFWTSTYRGGEHKYASDWVEWCYHETFPYHGEYRSWVLEVDPDAYVLEIDGPESCEALLRLGYMNTDGWEGHGYDFFRNRPQIDFEKLASVGVDGVHLTERGNNIMHLNLHRQDHEPEFDFNSWDAESTVWFRWAFRRVRVGPRIKIPERGW